MFLHTLLEVFQHFGSDNSVHDGFSFTYRKDGVYDFSGITLLVGDLPEQDGIVNAYDIGLIINNFGKRDSDILSKADVNMDGIVDTQDYSLVIAALSIRYDEE